MSNSENSDANRRKVLKGVTGAAAGFTVTTSTATAKNDNQSASVADDEIVEKLLAAANDPDVLSVTTKEKRFRDKNSVIVTEVETTAGKLVYGEFDRPKGAGVFNAYFEIDSHSGSNKGEIPKQFRRTPGNTNITLIENDGEIHPRRTATEKEASLLAEITDLGEDAVITSYDKKEVAFYVVSEQGRRFKVNVTEKRGNATFLQRPAISSLKSEKYEVVDVSGSDDVSAQHESASNDDCFDLFGPCPACAAGTVTCVACGASCVTGPQCALCLVATCGFAGGACGCCLVCIDNIPDRDNVACPD